jgi:predicted NBD/HSP70 family sugar kinase
VVIGGRLYRGWAELGHTVVELDGIPCQGVCTGRGHLEGYVTGVRATHLAQEAFGPAADAHRLTRLAREGDAQAREIIGGIGRYLGAGIATFIVLRASEPFHRILGKTGINVLTRIMGLVLATVSVQFILDGLREAGLLNR